MIINGMQIRISKDMSQLIWR